MWLCSKVVEKPETRGDDVSSAMNTTQAEGKIKVELAVQTHDMKCEYDNDRQCLGGQRSLAGAETEGITAPRGLQGFQARINLVRMSLRGLFRHRRFN